MRTHVVEIRRFPVKSMLGEEPDRVFVGANGIAGDRSHALIDVATGKVASAKSPRLWGGLLGLSAAYVDDAAPGAALRVRLPDGTHLDSRDPAFDQCLSGAIGRQVQMVGVPGADAAYEDEWPEIADLAPADLIEGTRTSVSPEGRSVSTLPVGLMAPGTFQDVAPITVLTTASLRTGAALTTGSRWDPRRFRANVLIDLDGDGFVENDWVGGKIRIGEATFEIFAPTPRCVMPTLAQSDLPADREILRTVAKNNRVDVAGTGLYACLGAYASVVTEGWIHRGDAVEVR